MKPIPLKIVIRISILFCILGFLLMAIGIGIGTNVGLIVLTAGLLVLIGVIVFMAVFYRCPHCGRSITIWYRNHYCPHCGNYLV